jgi:hypothetical protein
MERDEYCILYVGCRFYPRINIVQAQLGKDNSFPMFHSDFVPVYVAIIHSSITVPL